MLSAAMESPIRPARRAAPKYMMKKEMSPSAKKAPRATRNTLCTWSRRPMVLASDTILDRATGRPAVEMVSRTE